MRVRKQFPDTVVLAHPECSKGDNIAASHFDKEHLSLCTRRCPHMAKIAMADTLASVDKACHMVDAPPDIRSRALRPIERMLEIA